jgi:hypothetical protein
MITEIQCKECGFKSGHFTAAMYLIDLSGEELAVARERLHADLFSDGRLIAPSPAFDETARRATGKTLKALRAEGRVHVAWPTLCNACGHLNHAVATWGKRGKFGDVIEWARNVPCQQCRAVGGTPANPDMGRTVNSPTWWAVLGAPLVILAVTRSIGWCAVAFFALFAAAVAWDGRHARALRAHLAATKCPTCGRAGLREEHVGIS